MINKKGVEVKCEGSQPEFVSKASLSSISSISSRGKAVEGTKGTVYRFHRCPPPVSCARSPRVWCPLCVMRESQPTRAMFTLNGHCSHYIGNVHITGTMFTYYTDNVHITRAMFTYYTDNVHIIRAMFTLHGQCSHSYSRHAITARHTSQ